MSMAELREEIEDLKDKLSQSQADLFESRDIRDKQVGQLQLRIEKIKLETESEWKLRLENVRAEYEEKISELSDELDVLRNAFSGDTGAWVEIVNEVTGKVIYENTETGDVQDKEPEVIYIAKAMKRIEEADSLSQEFATLKKKYQDLDMKRKDLELTTTKLKTESTNLKSMEKKWKETAKSIFYNLTDVKNQFDAQADQILSGLAGLSNAGEKMSNKTKTFGSIAQFVNDLRVKVRDQQDKIVSLSGKVAVLSSELEDKTKKIQILSNGFDDEIERICKPLRSKVSELSTLLMKEKAGRAQDRRDMAALWPESHFMPTLLQKYRALTDQERGLRLKCAQENDASLALSLEIRANVAEAARWEVQFDDYGRKFFQHKKTGQQSWETPEICNYQPPPGRDENGNIVLPPESRLDQWRMMTDHKGQIFYRHKTTGEISYISPDSYLKIPRGKTRRSHINEAAHLVLSYLKYKIRLRKSRSTTQPPSSQPPQPISDDLSYVFSDQDEDPNEDLSLYLYDIESVEMLAEEVSGGSKSLDPEANRQAKRTFLEGFDPKDKIMSVDPIQTSTSKPSNLDDLFNDSGPLPPHRERVSDFLSRNSKDLKTISLEELRENLQQLSIDEENFETKLVSIRESIRDLSFVLIEKSNEKYKKKQTYDSDDEKSEEETEQDLSVEELDVKKLVQKKTVVEESPLDQASLDLTSTLFLLPSNDPTKGRLLNPPNPSHQTHSLNRSKFFSSLNSLSLFELDYGQLLISDPTSCNTSTFEISEEFQGLVSNLINYSLFCGFTNANPLFFSPQIQSMLQPFSDGKSSMDDQWLTSSFFVTVTPDQIDSIQSSLDCLYGPKSGLEGMSGLHATSLVTNTFRNLSNIQSKSTTNLHQRLQRLESDLRSRSQPSNSVAKDTSSDHQSEYVGFRKGDKFQIGDQLYFQQLFLGPESWSPSLKETKNRIAASHSLWLSRQFLGEILRYQIQQEVLRNPITTQDPFWPDPPVSTKTQGILKISKITLHFESQTHSWINSSFHFLRMSLGSQFRRTKSIQSKSNCFSWKHLEPLFTYSLPLEDIHYLTLNLKFFTESSIAMDALVAEGQTSLQNITFGTQTTIQLLLTSRTGAKVGSASITLTVDQPESDLSSNPDPSNHLHSEILSNSHTLSPVSMRSTFTPPDFPNQINENKSSFTRLVSELRGDGLNSSHSKNQANIVKLMCGDTSIEDLVHTGFTIDTNTVRPLPQFDSISSFLKSKEATTMSDLRTTLHLIFSSYSSVEESIDQFIISIEKLYENFSSRRSGMTKVVDALVQSVQKVQNQTNSLKQPIPQPDEPVFEELEEIPYVQKLPTNGALDSRGKKKPPINKKDLENILSQIDSGERDDKPWNFGESWPNNSQSQKLQSASSARNQKLDRQRSNQLFMQQKAIEDHKTAMSNWVLDEKKRLKELLKFKKECRKAYLKLDCATDRFDRITKGFDLAKLELETSISIRDFHLKSKERFLDLRAKQTLESRRQHATLSALKMRLLQSLDVRQRLLRLPASALSTVQFEEFREGSDEALKKLKFEIISCKQSLIEEGVRLKHFQHELISTARSELNRVRMTRDIIQQRDSIQKILERNRFEVTHLLESLEKFKLMEADNDDKGFETIGDLGEHYSRTKVWHSDEVANCQRQIDIIVNKISISEEAGLSASRNQLALLETMAAKWGDDLYPIRDSWVENSDFDRSRTLLSELIKWLTVQRQRLQQSESEVVNQTFELQKFVEASKSENERNIKTFESETIALAQSASTAVQVLQSSLGDLRSESSKNKVQLEKSVYDLSKECQKIREESYAQALGFDEKLKILWSIIRTLQTTAQSLSVQMDITKEQNNKLVISAKLETERTRQQLVEERKHNSNLLFVIHSQRGAIEVYKQALLKMQKQVSNNLQSYKCEKIELRKALWENIYTFSRLGTDVDSLFEFFAARLANLAGSKKEFNDALAQNNAAKILAVLCQNPRPSVRKYAARALGGLGWDGYVEHRVLVWDNVLHWKLFKAKTLSKINEKAFFDLGFQAFVDSGKDESLLRINFSGDDSESFVPPPNMRLSSLIKQRRQFALRVTKRNEGPNLANQKLLNIKDGVIPALMRLCEKDGLSDWEIARNAVLAISISSYEPQNHHAMLTDTYCVKILLSLCRHFDPEIQTHAALTIANLSFKDENGQKILGEIGVIPPLIMMTQSTIIDVLEASTSALANLTCYCDQNCLRVFEAQGVYWVIDLISHRQIENLLDADQSDEIQANAAEMLANISRFLCEPTFKYFDTPAIDSLVFMCASRNKQVKRHAPLVIGNLSQIESFRELVSQRGGIEALFLSLEDFDPTLQSNCLWALSNLMWHPPNQERAGRFLSEIIILMGSPEPSVQLNACSLAANLLYYNFANRIRFLESEGAMELLLRFVRAKDDKCLLEECLRSLLSLSYLDHVAIWLGNESEGNCLPLFLSLATSPYLSRETLRFSLDIICNLSIHHNNRALIVRHGGIPILVDLLADSDKRIQSVAGTVLDGLKDITPPEVLLRLKKKIDIDRMVSLATNADPLVRAVAAESIGEVIWSNPEQQTRVKDIGGVDALLAIISNPSEPIESLLPSLWSIRNLISGNSEVQTQFAHRDGVSVIVSLIRSSLQGTFEDQTERVLEGSLAVLVAAIDKDPTNSRRLISVGLSLILDIAEQRVPLPSLPSHVSTALHSEAPLSLSRAILLLLGPYNFVLCHNCGKKQSQQGQSCVHCGHVMRVHINEDQPPSLLLAKQSGKTFPKKEKLLPKSSSRFVLSPLRLS